MGTRDGAWKGDAKIAAGVDDLNDTHPLNCTEDGTLLVDVKGTEVPIDVIVNNIVPVSQSGAWTVNLGTEPTIDIGKVDQGNAGPYPWLVTGSFNFVPTPSTTATVVAETIGTEPVLVLGTNLNRKGFAIQNTNQVIYVKLDSTVSTALYSYELPKKGILEIENYCGPVAAVTASGSTIAMVTEKV
jgi:hypothetical protein